MQLSLSHWYPGSGAVLDVSIPDLCPLSYCVRINWQPSCMLFMILLSLGLKMQKIKQEFASARQNLLYRHIDHTSMAIN